LTIKEEDIVNEFIDLCLNNYNNDGHSSTKEQEHRYYELKHQILENQKKAEFFDNWKDEPSMKEMYRKYNDYRVEILERENKKLKEILDAKHYEECK